MEFTAALSAVKGEVYRRALELVRVDLEEE